MSSAAYTHVCPHDESHGPHDTNSLFCSVCGKGLLRVPIKDRDAARKDEPFPEVAWLDYYVHGRPTLLDRLFAPLIQRFAR